jgi:predicted DsbA family dithiol-disulfide isomerase
MSVTRKKLKVEIWSDVMCPFCYIGKRRFEQALQQFEHKDDVDIIWKSFQLDPDLVSDAGKSVNQYLAERKGWTLDYAKQMNDHVTTMAAQVGLQYDFDKAVVANSFDAHRVLQLAKTKGLGDALEEQLFKAYFTDGKNIADHNTLVEIGTAAGLNEQELKETLSTNKFIDAVYNDLVEAEAFGVSGVPFFVLDRKYGVSGAQQPELFLQALTRAHADWKQSQPTLTVMSNGDACDVDGDCN